MSEEITEKFREAIEQDNHGHSLDSIETRHCASDNYDGIEYDFHGNYVPVKPILDVVADESDLGIEEIGHVNDGNEHNKLAVFVADLSEEEPHPAFV
jgi:hypothetical protein